MIIKSEPKYAPFLNSDQPGGSLFLVQVDAAGHDFWELQNLYKDALAAATEVFKKRGFNVAVAQTPVKFEKPRDNFQSWIRIECRQEIYDPLTIVKVRRGDRI